MGSKYDKPHDQFVIAYLPYPDKSETVISHALPLAQMLQKGLILLYIEDKRYKGMSKEDATPIMEHLKEQIRQQHADTQYAVMRGDTHDIISALPQVLYGVVAVAQCDKGATRHTPTNPHEVLRLFNESKIAYLTAQEVNSHGYRHNDIAYSIDYRRESKEKLIWASYFARFGNNQLHVICQDYHDERLHQKWSDNMRFMDKIFDSLAIKGYQRHIYKPHGLFAETAVAERAAQEKCHLLISTTTEGYDRDIIEWFAGTAEQRVIANKDHLPVLFINPRDDLFVLCD
ncbi:MAG: hypothetical protein IJR13_01120 [Bacteroidales bacterium]|nr:hypothetical protein [Bacteroidales bacterium]